MGRTIEFDDNPPRPKGGTGEVIVKVGNSNVILNWVDDQITDVVAADEGEGIPDLIGMTMNEMKLGIVTCKKCARDSDTGATVCWPVPC